MNLWQFCLTMPLCAASLANVALAQSPEPVEVELHSGQRLAGLVDAQSTDRELVLRFERGSAVLWRSLSWTRIAGATVGGKTMTGAEFAKDYGTLATPARSSTERAKLQLPASMSSSTAPIDDKPKLQTPRVISIASDALLANWDSDVEADGLVIHLQPLDAWQQIAAAGGTLEVELYALQARAFHHASQSRGRSVEPVARWTHAVNPADYGYRGAVVQLPFQAAHPEFDDSLSAYGLVHLKFSVPGSGVFEQSIDGVRIRPWAPLRDYLQMDTGRRFLPHEGTGRGKTSWFTDDQ